MITRERLRIGAAVIALLLVASTVGGVAVAQTSGWQKPGDDVTNLSDAQAAINYWNLLPISDDPSQAAMWLVFGEMVDNLMEMDIRTRGIIAQLDDLDSTTGPAGPPGPAGPSGPAGPAGPSGVGLPLSCTANQVAMWDGAAWVCSNALADLQARVAKLEAKLAGVDRQPDGNGFDTLVFTGMNLQVVNGTGTTDGAPNGLGNLVIGYNADTFEKNDRSGSHYLVIGDEHTYTRFGGVVIGFLNTASGDWASVTGGDSNTASGDFASVTGGGGNTASGSWASVTGGNGNTASSTNASVSGGQSNRASGISSSVTGGWKNLATSSNATVTGGQSNTASGDHAAIAGGQENTASGTESTVSGGALNVASGNNASVSGGVSCTEARTNGWSVGARPDGVGCTTGN